MQGMLSDSMLAGAIRLQSLVVKCVKSCQTGELSQHVMTLMIQDYKYNTLSSNKMVWF
jgi:hypothetical protein